MRLNRILRGSTNLISVLLFSGTSVSAASAALVVVLLAGGAQAAGTMVIPGCTVPLSGAPQICSGAAAGGGAEGFNFTANPYPTQFAVSNSTVLVGVVGGGYDGISAGANASGTFGEFHLSAVADNGSLNTPGPRTGQTTAGSEIRALDGGVVGGAPGTIQDVRLTFTLDGLFAGDGEADAHLVLGNGTATLLNISPFIWAPRPSLRFTQDFFVEAGDQLSFYLQVITSANSANDGFSAEPHSSADVSNTGRLFLDVVTPGGTFTSLSGHNYASVASSVPEPSTFVLMLFALPILWLAKRHGYLLTNRERVRNLVLARRIAS